jgi:hypothetical protein
MTFVIEAVGAKDSLPTLRSLVEEQMRMTRTTRAWGVKRKDTNRDRILAAIHSWPDRDDDELAELADVRNRVTVNMIARKLEEEGINERRLGQKGKIVNRLRSLDLDRGSKH